MSVLYIMKSGLGRDVNETAFVFILKRESRRQGYNSDIERYL